MNEGLRLKQLIWGKGMTVEEAATQLGFKSRKTLYNHFNKEKLPEEIKMAVKDKLGIDITQNVSLPNSSTGKNIGSLSDELPISLGTEKEEVLTALATGKVVVDELAKLMAAVYNRDAVECKKDLLTSIRLTRSTLSGE